MEADFTPPLERAHARYFAGILGSKIRIQLEINNFVCYSVLMIPAKVNLGVAFDSFSEHWSPRIAGDINDMQVKLVKANGEFVWHHHDDEDELFLIIEGQMIMRFRDGDVELSTGELIVVPKGVEHQPIANGECKMLVFERNTTLNTGNTVGDLTARHLPRVDGV